MPVLVKRGYEDAITAEALLRVKARKDKAGSVSATDPIVWLNGALGGRYYPKQIEMAEAVCSHTQVSMLGSNSTGKDFMAARIALWWIAYWRQQSEPAMVVITAPTYRQIQQVIWQELRHAYLNARIPLAGTLYEQPLLKWDEQTFIVGFSTDKPYQLQGFHSPHLLVIVSEAHGVAQSHMDTLWRLNPNRILLTGNPISESGEFYDSHHSKVHLWHTITITAWDTPNVIEGSEVIPGLVTREDIERGARNWGEDSPLYRITYGGEWVEGMGQLVVVPLSWARRAEDAWEAEAYPMGKVGVLGVDVARFGQDKTIVCLRRGRVARKIWEAQGSPTTETADWLIEWHGKHPFDHIIVDGVGLGGGVIDQLRRAGVGCIEFQGGAAASKSTHFWDRNAEVWWRMREAYESGLAVMPDTGTRTEVSSRRYKVEKDKRIRLERKEDMRKEGRHSPDSADALSMTFALDWHLDGDRLTAGSDVDAHTSALRAEMTMGRAEDRPSLGFGRGTDMSPYHSSRWGKLGRGGRR